MKSTILSGKGSYIRKLKEFLAPAVGNPPDSQWLLCYRASSHGWADRDFLRSCDGKDYAVVIIKNDQYVFGGFTDIAWGNNYLDITMNHAGSAVIKK